MVTKAQFERSRFDVEPLGSKEGDKRDTAADKRQLAAMKKATGRTPRRKAKR